MAGPHPGSPASLGFNTIGNWSDPELGLNDRVPYTLPLSIVGDYTSISTGTDWWAACPTRLTRALPWPRARRGHCARDHRDDPWLIGYFADNELAWAGPGNDPKSVMHWPWALCA